MIFLVSFRFHSQEQKRGSTATLFKETGSASNYLYRLLYGTRSMCLTCDCNGNLSLSTLNKSVNDRHCFFQKLCTSGDTITRCWWILCKYFKSCYRLIELEVLSNILFLADWFQKFRYIQDSLIASKLCLSPCFFVCLIRTSFTRMLINVIE